MLRDSTVRWDRHGSEAKLDLHRKAWLALPKIDELNHRDPKDDSVVRRFALLAAALRMAIEAGLWPWSIEASDRGILAGVLRWANDKDSSVATLQEKAAKQKFREAILAARDASRLIVLNRQAGGRGGLTFKPAPEHAVLYQDVDLKNPGTLSGFIKNDGENTRILLYPDAFRRLAEGCGLDHVALADYLRRARLLEVKNEKVKGKPNQFYVLPRMFLHSESEPVNQLTGSGNRTE
jgi:hypothetical protein